MAQSNNLDISHFQQTHNQEDFRTLFRNSPLSFIPLEGSLVEGSVISIKRNAVVVSVGLKMNITFPLDELSSLDNIHIGSSILFSIETLETQDGEIILNHHLAQDKIQSSLLWSHLTKTKHVKGIVLNPVNGGFSIGVGGMVAFLPKKKAKFNQIRQRNKKIRKNSRLGKIENIIGRVFVFDVLKIKKSIN